MPDRLIDARIGTDCRGRKLTKNGLNRKSPERGIRPLAIFCSVRFLVVDAVRMGADYSFSLSSLNHPLRISWNLIRTMMVPNIIP